MYMQYIDTYIYTLTYTCTYFMSFGCFGLRATQSCVGFVELGEIVLTEDTINFAHHSTKMKCMKYLLHKILHQLVKPKLLQ